MARFSNKIKNVTYEGAKAVEKSLDQEWVNALCSSFLNGGFYESAESQTSRYVRFTRDMVAARGPQFVSKAAVFSRNVLGMRSVSALTAAILNEYKFEGKRDFYKEFFRRPDDVAEVFGAVDMLGGKRSHALVRGACDYLSSLSEYSLGKYKLAGRTYNMYDLINLTHAHSAAIEKYKNGTLPVPETWETVISAADAKEKGAAWEYLVENGKLGYMALLRNLRNIYNNVDKPASWWEEHVFSRLIDADQIKKSLVFPYRLYVAYRELESTLPSGSGKFLAVCKTSLGLAFLRSINNLPLLEGDNLLAVDVSGSMGDPISPKSDITLKEVGACYAAMLLLGGGFSDYVKFGTKAAMYTPRDFSASNIFDQIDDMANNDDLGCATCVNEIWPLIKGASYDRIFIISDMQVMDEKGAADICCWSSSSDMTFGDYCESAGETPKVYTFDLGQYHNEPASFGGNINYFTALSETTLKFISLLESGVSICDYIDSGCWA